MKKRVILFSFIAMAASAMAQLTNYDVARFSANEIDGTARYTGVGGAMGALGGDASAIFSNPAGIGIYRSSEITLSGNVGWTNSSMTGAENAQDVNVHLSNASYVGTWTFDKEKGLLNINFGASYNRSRTFDRVTNGSGNIQYSASQAAAAMSNGTTVEQMTDKNRFDNNNLGWLPILAYETYATDNITDDTYTSVYDMTGGNVKRNVHLQEYGQLNDFAINLGGNVSNYLFWGMAFTFNEANYTAYQTHTEVFEDGTSLDMQNTVKLHGAGFTYKIGLIGAPTKWLRIGAAYHTPSVFRLTSTNYSHMYTNGMNDKGTSSDLESPSYAVRSYSTNPMKVVASMAFLLGKYGFFGIDYQWANYSGMSLRDNTQTSITTVNDYIKENLNDMHTLRAGIEMKPIESLALRLGGVYSSSYDKKDNQRVYYINDTRADLYYCNEIQSYAITAGAGYRIGRHNLDLSYIWQVNQSTYHDMNNNTYDTGITTDNMYLRSVRNQIVLTYGIRF